MNRSTHNYWLTCFAIFTAFATLILVCVGGLVTSHEAGMAVPDWPNSYGYNMFLFPISKWVGNILYEHTHRLVASWVGVLTTILAIWLWRKDSRPWLRKLGFIAFVAVLLQGILGGLRVTQMKDEIGIFHAILAQIFFIVVSSIALFTTQFWQSLLPLNNRGNRLKFFYLTATLLIFLQLLLGAVMRHQHAGLAISDFPTAYGKIWPDLDAASVAVYNQNRIETGGYKEITAFQIALQMAHRIGAILILISVMVCAWKTSREFHLQNPLTKLSLAWVALILIQIFLGAATIWKGKAADIATAHVAAGAISLLTGAFLCLISFRVLRPTQEISLPEKILKPLAISEVI